MPRSKKIIYSIDKLSSDEIYAILDRVDSEDEDNIDNIMNDSDTEFATSDNPTTSEIEGSNRPTDHALERGLEAVIHVQENVENIESENVMREFKWKCRGPSIERRTCQSDAPYQT